MKKPIQYTIEPAKGQALLSFQGRRLPDKIEWFETTVTEEVRQNGQKKLKIDSELNADFRNLLIHGDCLSACAYLKSENIKVDLVYIDPPFATGANWTKKIYLRNGGRNEIDRQNQEIGEEIMYGDIWQKEDYLNWLYERLLAIRYVMNSDAAIYLHIDSTVGHYVKVMMDEIFGDWEFAEIVWVCGLLGSGDFYPKSHESIYCYRSEKSFFNSPQKLGLSPRITGALSKDENGWLYTRGRESSGGSTYLKTYVSKNPNHTKEEAIEEANRLRNHPVWSVWMGKDELGKAFNENGVGTYAELVSLDELLSQKADVLYTPDNAVIEMKQEGKLWIVEIKKYFSSYLKNKINDFNNKKVKPKQQTLDENGENGNGNGNEEEQPNGKPKIQISESGLELIETVQFDTSLRKDGVWTSNLDMEDKAGVKEKIKAVYRLTTDKFKMKIRNISGDEIIIDSSEIKKMNGMKTENLIT